MTYRQIGFEELGVTPGMVYRQMGYGEQMPASDVVAETDEVLRMAATVARPAFCYTVTPSPPPFDWGRIINRQLQGTEAYACFLCTAGEEYAGLQASLQADIVRSFIADALGSVMAECTADFMERVLQASIDKLGWKRTNRFSPGYCGWHVSQQQLLFPLFGHPNPCHIRLTDSSLMLPEKSVSGIIGLGSSVRHLPYVCGLCDMQDCFKRHRSLS